MLSSILTLRSFNLNTVTSPIRIETHTHTCMHAYVLVCVPWFDTHIICVFTELLLSYICLNIILSHQPHCSAEFLHSILRRFLFLLPFLFISFSLESPSVLQSVVFFIRVSFTPTIVFHFPPHSVSFPIVKTYRVSAHNFIAHINYLPFFSFSYLCLFPFLLFFWHRLTQKILKKRKRSQTQRILNMIT